MQSATQLGPTACTKGRTAGSAQNATQLGSTTCTHNRPVGNTQSRNRRQLLILPGNRAWPHRATRVAVLNTLLLLLRASPTRLGEVTVAATLGSWPRYPLHPSDAPGPGAGEGGAAADLYTVQLDRYRWRYTSASADKHTCWHLH